MKIFGIILIIILVIIVIIAALIGMLILFFYAIAAGIGYKYKTESEAWEYWENMKVKKWTDLTEEEKNRLVIACMIISDDVGAVVTEERVIEMLKSQLPVLTPNVGLTYTSQ